MSKVADKLRRLPGFRSIGARLCWLTIFLTAAVVLTLTALQSIRETGEKLARGRTNNVAAATALAQISVSGLLTGSKESLDQVVQITSMHPEYSYLEIFDARGALVLRKMFFGGPPTDIASSIRMMAEQNASIAHAINAPGFRDALEGESLRVLAPIIHQPSTAPDGDPVISGRQTQVLGYLHLGISLSELVRDIKGNLAEALASGLLLILIGAFLTVLLTRKIVGPLESLTSMAERVASGDLEGSVDIRTGDELQVLGESFNRMGVSLRQSKAQITEYQGGLEEIVKRRTAELQKAANQAQQLAQRDVLTGLANRSLLNSRLHFALAQAERRNDRVVVACINLENFTAFNQTHGRETGDDLLQAVGSRLSASVREGDTVARTDADKFVVVIGDVRSPSAEHDIARLIHNLSTSIKRPYDLDGRKFSIPMCIGAAIYPDDGSSARTVLANAREAMGRANATDSHRFFKIDMEERIARRSEVEQGLRTALADDKLIVNFDPVINLALGSVVRADANLSWQHPEQGPIPCHRLMTMAEEVGLHAPIAAHFLRRACEAAARIQVATPRKAVISMRITARQAQQPDLLSIVDSAIRASGADPELIAIGIPESAVAADLGAAVILMHGLRGIGVRVIIDEYGTGATNLSDLSRLPIDAIVIDRSFVRGLAGSASDRSVVQAYIAMAHSLGLRLAAETVDDASSLGFLRAHGCDEAQGAMFGHQADEVTITRMLASPDTDTPTAITLGPSLLRH